MLALVVANFKSQRPAEMVREFIMKAKTCYFIIFYFSWFGSSWNVNVLVKLLSSQTSSIKIKTLKFSFVNAILYFQVESYHTEEHMKFPCMIYV